MANFAAAIDTLAKQKLYYEAECKKLRALLREALPFIDGHTKESRALRQTIANVLDHDINRN